MVEIVHFSHDHLLSLVHLQLNHNKESSHEDDDEYEEKENDCAVEFYHVGRCDMCKEQIYSFHVSYYDCNNCNYSLHKFCAELPTILQNHPLHPNHHNLTLSEIFQYSSPNFTFDYEWICGVCNVKRKNFFNYHCSICKFSMDIICATMSQQNMDHPSHPHQLQRMLKNLVSCCNACGREHEGTFYHCTTCFWPWIHQDCALLPVKLFIQQPTNDTFTHSHPLTLAYTFPVIDQESKFCPFCRVCGANFYVYFWLYKCDKCQYYVHIHCATSSYIHYLRPGRGKTFKNYKDEDHPNIVCCPFPDESYNLLKQHLFSHKEFIVKENHDEMLNHFSHQHPLVLLDTQTSLINNSVFLHNPMKKIQLLCDGCVRPITTMPFYKCLEDVRHCGFVLHEWCTKLPSKVQDHPGHPEHELFLITNIRDKFLNVFRCWICDFLSNGFAYGCTICNYYIDINCAFLPKEITHEAHANHLLSRINASQSLSEKRCDACNLKLIGCLAFQCSDCGFYLHPECAFFLPRMIKHKYDKHPLILRYNPIENHPGDYFCEICEEKFNPQSWFYHCSFCMQSMHPACSTIILKCEQSVYAEYDRMVFEFVNVKFGGTLEIEGHPHRLAFVQGIESHGQCKHCDEKLQYEMIYKCLECEYAFHYKCG